MVALLAGASGLLALLARRFLALLLRVIALLLFGLLQFLFFCLFIGFSYVLFDQVKVQCALTQAARLSTFAKPDLSGSAVASVRCWVSSASCLVCSAIVSSRWRAYSVDT